MRKMYKILDRRNGLCYHPSSGWTTGGKIWYGMGPLKNHMNHNRDEYIRMGENFQVIECEVLVKKRLSLGEIKPDWVVEDIIES